MFLVVTEIQDSLWYDKYDDLKKAERHIAHLVSLGGVCQIFKLLAEYTPGGHNEG